MMTEQSYGMYYIDKFKLLLGVNVLVMYTNTNDN